MVAQAKTDIDPRHILATPAGFARGILGLQNYAWQDRALTDLEVQGAKISCVCCNEAGKTTHLGAPAILWALSCFPGAQAVVTSGSWRQVKTQLFPAMKRWTPILPGWDIHDTSIAASNGSSCVGFSTDDAGKFEGFHVGPGGHRETPLLILVDEAKSVDASIFQAIDRCRPTWLLLMSSPGPARGVFYESHTKHAAAYKRHKVTAADCPHISQATIDEIIARYGINHPFVRSSIFAEFSDEGGTGQVMTLTQVQANLRNPPAPKVGERCAWLDFAAGGDENTITLREGNRIRIVRAWRETNTMVACGEFISEFRKLNLRPQDITADEGGLGKVMLDRLAELGWPVNRFNSNEPASDKRAYFNRSAEIWDQGAQAIDRRQFILPDDPVLLEQLTGRLWKRFSDGRLQLESKEEMKKRGLNSPDRAEGVLGCMQDVRSYMPQDYTREDPFQLLDNLQQMQDRAIYAGFNAGG